jgi:putative tricarboxylic transport membrane protein
MKAASADFWSGLALAGLGAYIVVEAARWEYLGPDGPGSGFFPLWYGIAMVALSLLLMVFSLTERPAVDWSGAGRALGAWAAMAVAVAALKLLGFVICFAALSFFVAAVMYRRPLAAAAITAAAGAGAFYLVFPLALGVKLP